MAWLDRNATVLAIIAAVVLVFVGGVAINIIAGFGSVPKWWSTIESTRTDHAMLVEKGEQLENAITTQLTAVRDPDDSQWASAMDVDQINAWLETRLVETIQTHQGDDAWPTEIDRVRIDIIEDQLIIGMRMLHATGGVILWIHADLELDNAGDLWMTISNAHIGMTRVPMRVLNRFASNRFSKSKYYIGRGNLSLGDGRKAQLKAIRINKGRMELVIDTLVAID